MPEKSEDTYQSQVPCEERKIFMKNKRWLRLTGWLLAVVMILTVFPMATFAESGEIGETESNLYGSPDMLKRPEEVDVTDIANITYTDASGNDIQLNAMDPNKQNRMKVAVSGLSENNAIGDTTELAVTIPENVKLTDNASQSFSNETVNASLDGEKLILSWKSGKQDSVEASIAVLPNLPSDENLSGSYALITKTNVMVGSTTWLDGSREKLKSYKTKTVDGKIQPEADERSIWTLKHVSGSYYAVYSQTAGKYLKIKAPNHATLEAVKEENAQKILVQKTSDGYYTFTFEGLGLNNSGNNATKGFASYTAGNADNEKFRLYAASDILYTDMIIFDANGGNTAAPETVSGEAGTVITLPDLNATKNGESFIGWAEVKDFYSAVPGTKHTYHALYKAGTSYTLKEGKKTLYAVYNPTVKKVQFGIRQDGVIQDEPNGYPVDKYKGHFSVDGILKEGHWVIDIDSTKPVNDYYVNNDVIAALNWVPSAEQIAAALKKEGNIDFDPETQYIHYYVLKCTSATVWKVDGVIRNKANVEITYNANVPAGKDKTQVADMPGAYQVSPGTDILIGAAEGSNEVRRPRLDGYYFTGWNSKKDGTGVHYSENDIIHLTENLSLYAQWISAADTPLKIVISSDWIKEKTGYVGARITLTGTLYGFDGRLYTLQWQYSDDLVNWHDVPDAHELTYTYTLDETTTNYTWRLIARDIK
jgi:uncharacterized repeat protein (TIGR02543 family)